MCHGGHYSPHHDPNARVNGSVIGSFRFSNLVDSVTPMSYWPTVNHHDLRATVCLCAFTTATVQQQCERGKVQKRAKTEGCNVNGKGTGCNEVHKQSPVDDSSIVDRVVDINRIIRQVHLSPHWSVV